MPRSGQNDPTREDLQQATTNDSRFHDHYNRAGVPQCFCMYSGNITAEADGLACHELNILRALTVDFIAFGIANVFAKYALNSTEQKEETPRSRLPIIKVPTSLAILLFALNILRIICTLLCLLLELCIWPIRVYFGVITVTYGIPLPIGSLGGFTVVQTFGFKPITRRIKVNNSAPCRIRSIPASCFGKVLWFETLNHSDALYIVSLLKLQQRCGTGPECILLDGKNIFVSWWTPWTITSFFRGSKTEWNLFNSRTFNYQSRRMVFEMNHDKDSGMETTSNDIEGSRNGFAKMSIRFSPASPDSVVRPSERSPAVDISGKSCGQISTLHELEDYYYSPLGWNKYHRMRKEGNKIRVSRPDRRLMSHLLALASSFSLYYWYKDSSQGRFGLFVDLQALILANYAFITAYAGEILVGPYSEVVDAKSERYGIIVTRAIDEGFVRGFHVPNGNWLLYKNGEKGSEVHKITKTEINATCNSVVREEENGMKIKVIGYNDRFVEAIDWVGD